MNCVLLLAAVLSGSSRDDELTADDRRHRAIGPPATSHVYALTVAPDVHVRVTVVPGGIDPEVLLTNPSASVGVDDMGAGGREELEWIGESGAAQTSYRIEVRNKRPAMAGSYEIRVSPPRPATREDRDRVAAARARWEGRQLLKEQKAERTRQAMEAFGRALVLSRGGGDARGQALALMALGTAHATLSDHAAALDHREAALGLWQDLGDARQQAAALTDVADTFQKTGRLEESLECADHGLAIAREAEDPEGEVKALLALAVPQSLLGQLAAAADSNQRALGIARTLGDRESEVFALSNLAGVHLSQNDLQRALDVIEETLALNRERGDRWLEALNLNTLGLVYTNLGDARRALQSHERSLALCREQGDRMAESIVLNNIGLAHRLDGNYECAIEALEASLVLKRAGGDRRGEARTLVSLSSVHIAQGDYARARSLLEQSLSMPEGRRPESEVMARINLAVVSLATGQLEAARDECLQALSLSQRPDGPGVWLAAYRLAQVEKARGALVEAEELVELVLEMLDSQRAQMRSVDFRASLLASQRDVYDFHVNVLMARHAADPAAGFDARALQAVERARARSLLDLLAEARVDIREGVEPGLREREKTLLDRLSAAGVRSVRAGASGPSEEAAVQREVEGLTRELERVGSEIRARSPRYAALTRPEPITVPELQALLDDDTLLLEFALGRDGSYAWLVGARSLTSVVLPPRQAIDDAARRVLAAMESEKADAEAPAATLSAMVLAPFGDRLASRRLVVVADGALQYVPFAALPHPKSGEALVVRHEVVSLPSASTLAALRQERRTRVADRGVVAVLADPVFDRSDERLARRRPAPPPPAPGGLTRAVEAMGIQGPIPRLPFTRREAQAILAAAPARSSLGALDFEASRATAMGETLARYRIVHFATHGFLNASRPELSGLVLSLFDRQGRSQPGFLTAADAFNLKLSADLVVLSGCRTALGKEVKGEGLVGLTRGFMYAGASRVLASLWLVDDAATAHLMSRLYSRVLGLEALSPPAALRAAQLDLMKQPRYRHPHFWAAFQLQGEWK